MEELETKDAEEVVTISSSELEVLKMKQEIYDLSVSIQQYTNRINQLQQLLVGKG